MPSIKDPAGQIRQLRIWALLLCALLAVGAVIWVALRLQRDAAALNAGLSRMEQDLNFRVAPIPGEFGAIAAAVNRMADRREGLESALRRQDRLAALGRVVAGVAHEIRNPLNSLRLTLELMKRRAGHGAVAAEQAEAAVNEVDRLDAILSRFLAFGRHELSSRQIQPVAPIVERVRRMASPAAEERGIRLEIRSPNSLPEADIDSLACEQVLLNLLLNAIEASPPATTVRLEAHAVEGWILLEVRDRGPGIAPSVREHIFDPYFTTKAEGAGLGLAVSRELVLRHEGVLDLDTGPDGSTFSVRLPLRRVV